MGVKQRVARPRGPMVEGRSREASPLDDRQPALAATSPAGVLLEVAQSVLDSALVTLAQDSSSPRVADREGQPNALRRVERQVEAGDRAFVDGASQKLS